MRQLSCWPELLRHCAWPLAFNPCLIRFVLKSAWNNERKNHGTTRTWTKGISFTMRQLSCWATWGTFNISSPLTFGGQCCWFTAIAVSIKNCTLPAEPLGWPLTFFLCLIRFILVSAQNNTGPTRHAFCDVHSSRCELTLSHQCQGEEKITAQHLVASVGGSCLEPQA